MFKKACLFIASAVLTVGVAQADETGQWYLVPMATFIDGDEDRLVDDEVNGFHIGLGQAVGEAWNVELMAGYADLDGFAPQEQVGIGVNVLRVFNRQGAFSPFFLVGLGNLETEIGSTDENNLAAAAGAGFLWDVFGRTAIRGEYRYRWEDADNELGDHLVSLGLQFPLGGGAPKVVDSDGDGVPDGRDRCPNTPAGTPVDEFGCELDSDGDGVADSRDRCPNTPAGVTVDENGCALDSDRDGVPDGRDRCPNTVAGAPVDENGCELDGDGDGIVDRLDECPNTRPGVAVDIRGCEIREEIALPDVNFETNSDVLLPGAERTLNDAAATLRRNPTLIVEVAGHTDSQGAAEYNQGLSERRAKTVEAFLIDAGVDSDRLSVRGYGEGQPIADNTTADGRAQNRRVVLRVLER